MSFTINPDTLLGELEAVENVRLQQAETALRALRSVNVLGMDGLAGSVASSQQEIAALAMARAEGGEPSVAELATQNAMTNAGTPMSTGSMLGDIQAQSQAAGGLGQIAAQGGMARAQESAQMRQLGLDTLGVSRAVRSARMNKQQELALALTQIGLENEARSAGRAGREAQARLGIQTEQYTSDLQQRDANLRQFIGGGLTLAGTAMATRAGRTDPNDPTGQIRGVGRANTITTKGPGQLPAIYTPEEVKL